MDECISKKYLDDLLDYYLTTSTGAEHYGYSIIKGEIKRAPIADVVDVVNGHWIKHWTDNNLIGHEYEECSICGCSMLDTNQFWDSLYCPNCGAKMW
jgi:hypothetical protein